MEFGDSPRAAEDRERWKCIVAKSSVVPQRRTGIRTFKVVPGNPRVCIFPGNQPIRFIVT